MATSRARKKAPRPDGAASVKANNLQTELAETWSSLRERCAPATADRAPADLASLNEALFDADKGLGVLARAVCIRSVLRDMILRTHKDAPADANVAWQYGLSQPRHAVALFKRESLAPTHSAARAIGADALSVLLDPAWRAGLCKGFWREGTDRHVAGLNRWFGDRYADVLPGGAMTPALLFDTPFFGARAPDRYIDFLCTGRHVPDCNATLSSHAALPDNARPHPVLTELGEQSGELDDFVSLLAGENGTRPIVTMSCEDSTAFASRIATTLVARLANVAGASACYLPVGKSLGDNRLGDHGFRAITESLYRFTLGYDDLTPRLAQQWSERDLAAAIRAVRRHLTTVPTVLVFDGFFGDSSDTPAIVDFVRDEPVSRLLRLLQYPDIDTPPPVPSLAAFRRTFFVVVGQPSSKWLAIHRNRSFKFAFERAEAVLTLKQEGFKRLATLAGETTALAALIDGCASGNTLQLLNAFAGRGVLALDAAQSAHGWETLLQRSFDAFWSKATDWQKVFLQALSLSSTGLRLSTTIQLLEICLRPAAAARKNGEVVSLEEFRKFVAGQRGTPGVDALLVDYNEGVEEDAIDVFDHPSQSLSGMTYLHPWLLATHQSPAERFLTMDFAIERLRDLVRATIDVAEERRLRRLLAEMALQAYRMRVRHGDARRRVSRRAARSLVESIYQGFKSLDFERAPSAEEPPLFEVRVGEIPAHPAEAFSFIYFTLYQDLLCDGRITNIGRIHGNGSLELELLLFTADPRVECKHLGDLATAGTPLALPRWTQWRIGHASHGAFRKPAIEHLFALARCARRATRTELLSRVVQRLRRVRIDEELSAERRLEISKYEVDLSLRAFGATDGDRDAAKAVWKETRTALKQILFKNASEEMQQKLARGIERAVRTLRQTVRRSVLDSLVDQAAIDVAALDAAVDGAYHALNGLLTALDVVTHDALALMTRLAILQGSIAARNQAAVRGSAERRHKRKLLDPEWVSIVSHAQAVALYWWVRRVSSRRTRENPLLVRSRLGAENATEYIATAVSLRALLVRHAADRHAAIIDRLDRSMRQTLDTFTREQGVDKSDHILAQILESKYLRSIARPTESLVRKLSRPEDAMQRVLAPLYRCYAWLSQAERELLSFKSRPTHRVLLCIERIDCSLAWVDWAFGDATERLRPLSGPPDGLTPRVLEWLEHDLNQLEVFDAFMASYSPSSHALRHAWRVALRGRCGETVKLVHSRLGAYRDGHPDWRAAVDRLYKTAQAINDRLQPPPAPGKGTDETAGAPAHVPPT